MKNPLTKLVAEIYAEGYSAAASKLTSEVRRKAYLMGWPTSISRQLLVDVNSAGQYVVRYPKQLTKAIMNLEYGDQNTPPTPAIRGFLKSIGNTDMQNQIAKSLKKRGVI